MPTVLLITALLCTAAAAASAHPALQSLRSGRMGGTAFLGRQSHSSGGASVEVTRPEPRSWICPGLMGRMYLACSSVML